MLTLTEQIEKVRLAKERIQSAIDRIDYELDELKKAARDLRAADLKATADSLEMYAIGNIERFVDSSVSQAGNLHSEIESLEEWLSEQGEE